MTSCSSATSPEKPRTRCSCHVCHRRHHVRHRRCKAVTLPGARKPPWLSPFLGKRPSHSSSKKDLVKAYHQILIAEADIPKPVVATPLGLFEFLFMTFGIKFASQALQRLKDTVLMGFNYVFFFSR